MNLALRTAALVLFLAASVYAADPVKEFSFRTNDGKTFSYRAGVSPPTVINLSAHW